MPGIYFDEAEIGSVIPHQLTRTVTEADNVLFCAITHNPQPLHLDEEYAKQTEFGQRVFNSMYTVSFACGVSIEDTTMGTLVVNLGFGEMKFPKPVFINDTLRVVSEIKDKRESKSRPDAGIVTFEHKVYNQRDELVCSIIRIALLKRRVAATEAA
ncbi:MaoC family dehydratase [Pseudomaricurvus alkylphenolicus]|jgi:acyl dehydratase|uniref:MaoC family dehydratase n=1 Tax=Pseudomaricurvus alkylphenolicus TaxID=1306991 RepID=UPI001422CCE3|nr:MaoC family dehydratase [Pseudomaricurvus alkylphenolicus]NIB38867.1 MaoC family dehydratase [Pseudomaricurvus alkylphenolicus]